MIKRNANEELIDGVLSRQYFLQASYVVDCAAAMVSEISTTGLYALTTFSPLLSLGCNLFFAYTEYLLLQKTGFQWGILLNIPTSPWLEYYSCISSASCRLVLQYLDECGAVINS